MRRSLLCAAGSAAALLAFAACVQPVDSTDDPPVTENPSEQGVHGLAGRGHGGHGGHSSGSSASSSSHAASSTSGSSSSHAPSTSSCSSSRHSASSSSISSYISSSASSSSSTGAASSSSSGGGGGGIFTAPNPWNTPVASDPVSPSSSAITGWLAANGGWGTGSMRIDFSINVLTATASTPILAFTPTEEFYTPDCDHVPVPVPAGGAVEGEQGYTCTQGGDCHLIVVDPLTEKLYEMWEANISGSTFTGGCVAVWDLGKSYPANLRGDGCTSADAGGFPIAAMLFTADEVYAGEIPHAIRFILPNARIRGGDVYVHPGTHTTGATSGGPNAPPYGVRFRLRPDYPLASLPSTGARVVAQAMQKYGLFLADGGNIALTAADDRFTTHTWAEVGVDASSLTAIQVSDMQVVDMGSPVAAGDCVRNP